MTRTRILLGLLAASAAAAVLLLGGVLASSPAASPVGQAESTAVAGRFLGGFGAGDTAEVVRRLQDDLRARPDDVRTLGVLGVAYEQRARETADFSYLTKAEGVLERAIRLDPRDPLATAGLASLALSRHEFREALRLGRRARALAPYTAHNYGLVGDALVELGRYDEAFATFERMNALKPNLASYARISYARELVGRPREAIAAMELALDAASGQPEPSAWTHVELGKLRFGLGELDRARWHFRAALAAFPGYVYAFDGLARVEAAAGNRARAIAFARRAADAVPLPQFVTTLGDLYRAGGQERLAREQYSVVGAIERLLAANGVRNDLETALFDVDHGLRLPQALERARRAYADRPSIEGDDVLAWALARNGRCGEALRYSKRATRLGTRDALKFFHRGMIERCLGHEEASRAWLARALETNPHFSLVWAPVARRYSS
jgi:tetratricopeptide (TPR) repeat protein